MLANTHEASDGSFLCIIRIVPVYKKIRYRVYANVFAVNQNFIAREILKPGANARRCDNEGVNTKRIARYLEQDNNTFLLIIMY